MSIPFKTIRSRAEKRKGGAKALQALLPPKPEEKALARLGDDRAPARAQIWSQAAVPNPNPSSPRYFCSCLIRR
ncbi:hypothetical protein SAMN05444159_3123 [Bradyrhizobium lablabi]|uniref:Uncharacterized protein n=1 Tax=Bradyrhizobium lablabi TaxID=722472 RepID=A0A1M6S106_9BRAD|nr:hypothetical protein SAMN05444159_3123 [Bradyrhizobium lablabi]